VKSGRLVDYDPSLPFIEVAYDSKELAEKALSMNLKQYNIGTSQSHII
jgi:hypothetical protein